MISFARAAEDRERQRIAQGGYVFPAAIAHWEHPLVQTRRGNASG